MFHRQRDKNHKQESFINDLQLEFDSVLMDQTRANFVGKCAYKPVIKYFETFETFKKEKMKLTGIFIMFDSWLII